ncbi:5497_t:CDS:2 [Cetraspora pellucida]|uniref:5497_t:CDS:1 n=1 Tax=Cetraspora pellucida TaxID=1433469 RepID=A0A9N9EFM1_9GLOM|nr:5497_t:CDS:2 [Cetraspora pellucida]
MSLVEPGKHFIDLTDNSHYSKHTRVQDLKNKDDCITNIDPNYSYCEQTIEYDREYVNDNSECDSTINKNEKIVLSHKNMNKGKEKMTQSVMHNTRNHRAKHAGLSWHILEINKGFEKNIEKHADWLQIIDPELSKEFLKEFRDTVSFNELQELPCAVCLKLNNYKHYKEIPIENIDLNLLKAPNELIASSFEINFYYNDPYIDNINSNILLDRAGFIYPLNYQNTNNDNLTNNSLVL